MFEAVISHNKEGCVMDHRRFSLFDAVTWAVRSFLDNFRLFGGALLAVLVLFAGGLAVLLLISRFTFFLHQAPDMRNFLWQFKLSGVLQPRTTEVHVPLVTGFGLFIFMGTLALVSLLSMGYAKICLLFQSGVQAIPLRTLFSCWRQIITFMVTTLFSMLVVLLGFSFLIIPGIYLMLRLCFFKYLIVDTHAGIMESLSKSYAMTAGYEWELLAMLVLTFFVGTFIPLWPVIELMYVYAYRKLSPAAMI